MVNNGSIFTLPPIEAIRGLLPYEQYGDDEAIRGFFKELKTIFMERMQDSIDNLQNISRDQTPPSPYLQFYYENIMGFLRSFGESRVEHLYDTDVLYDEKKRYDEAEFDGMLDLRDYQILCKYLVDYSQEGFTIGWLVMFLSEFLKTSDFELELDFTKITITTKNTQNTKLLQQIFRNRHIYDNLPMFDISFKYI